MVAKLIAGLGTTGQPIELVPVVWSDLLGGLRLLDAAETQRLASGEPPPAAVATSRETSAESPRELVRRVGKGAVRRAGLLPTLKRIRTAVLLRTRNRFEVPLALEPERGSVLLELDTVWNVTQVDRPALYRDLHRRGASVAVLVYDLLPIEYPEWFEDSLVRVFTDTVDAQARHADVIMAISQHTRATLTRWASEQHIDLPEVTVIPLGADLRPVDRSLPAIPAPLQGAQYVLVVGTVEPRKNHATLLDAFEGLRTRHPDLHLVVVGRAGWTNDDVIDRLKTHEAAGSRLHWIEHVDDELLTALYRSATVVAVPSITEGFGLPVIEALSLGVPVVSSDGGALPEAGGDLVDLVDPTDTTAWTLAIGRHLDDVAHAESRREALASYRAPRWSSTCEQTGRLLLERFASGVGSADSDP